jgi:hypothetical protein
LHPISPRSGDKWRRSPSLNPVVHRIDKQIIALSESAKLFAPQPAQTAGHLRGLCAGFARESRGLCAEILLRSSKRLADAIRGLQAGMQGCFQGGPQRGKRRARTPARSRTYGTITRQNTGYLLMRPCVTVSAAHTPE